MAGVTRSRKFWAAGAAALLVFGTTFAVAQDDRPRDRGRTEADQEARDQGAQDQEAQDQRGRDRRDRNRGEQARGEQRQAPQRLAVLRLRHADPQQLADLLRSIDQPTPYAAGYRGAGPGAAHHGPGPDALAHAAAQQGAAAGHGRRPLLIAFDKRSNTLFLRGDQDRVDELERLVESLDAEGDIEATKLGDARIVPIRNGDHAEVVAVLQQLQLPATAFRLGERSVVILRGEDEELLSQAEEVVNALDQASQAEGDRQDRQQDQQGQGGQPGQDGQQGQPNQGAGGAQGGAGGAEGGR